MILYFRLENEQLLRRVRQLEHARDQLSVPQSQSDKNLHKSEDWTQVERSTLTTDGGNTQKEVSYSRNTGI